MRHKLGKSRGPQKDNPEQVEPWFGLSFFLGHYHFLTLFLWKSDHNRPFRSLFPYLLADYEQRLIFYPSM